MQLARDATALGRHGLGAETAHQIHVVHRWSDLLNDPASDTQRPSAIRSDDWIDEEYAAGPLPSEIEADGEHTAECTDSSEQFFWKAPRFSVQSGSVGVGGDHVEPRAVDAALPQRVKRRGVRFEDVRGQLPVVELNAVNRIARHLARRRRIPQEGLV